MFFYVTFELESTILNLNFFCKRPVFAVLLVLLAGSVVYVNTFQVPFVLDDRTSITHNVVIKNLENFYANSSGYEFLPNRYIAFLTFALNYHFGGLNVFGYHLVNLIIHLANALLVFTLLRLTFRTTYFQTRYSVSKSSLFTPSCFIPLFAALLFAVHPIQTQAVTYIVQRLASLATLFYLLSVALFVKARLSIENSEGSKQKAESRSRESEENGQPPAVSGESSGDMKRGVKIGLLFTGSVIAAILAMKTKEISFTLPLAIVLYEGCFFQGPWKRRFLYLLPLLATLPIVPLTVLHIGAPAGDVMSGAGTQLRVGTGVSRLDYLFTQFRVIVTYLRLLIYPVHQNIDYDYPVYRTFFTPSVFLSFLLLASIFSLAVYLFLASRLSLSASRKAVPPEARLIAFGIFWFFLTLAVESSLIPIQDVIVEHRLYLPAFGAAAVFATAFYWLAERVYRAAGEKLFLLVAVLLLLGLGFMTYQRNHVWGNAIRLWQDSVANSPKKGRANNNLGVALEEAGHRAEAIKAMSRAIAVDPDYYKSYYNLADLYLVSDQPEASLPLLQTAIRLNPDFTEAYVDMGAALMRAGRYRDVIAFLERNRDRIKGQGEAHFYLGMAYIFTGNRQAALKELPIVSRRDPALAASLAAMLGVNASPNASHGHH